MQFLGAILIAGLFITVQGQLVDKTVIEDGSSFNLTCDVGRIGNVPAAVTALFQLAIERTVLTSRKPAIIASYSPFLSQNLTKFIPDGRRWVIEASGGRGSVAPDNNRASVKLTLYVTDAQCADAGLYTCNASFPATHGVSSVSRSQKLTYKAETDVPVLTLDHHNGNAPDSSNNMEGQTVKLTCSFEGPDGLAITWLVGPIRGTNFVPYPLDNGVQMVTPSPTNDPCKRGKYESTLTFKVPAVDTMYICVARDADDETSRKTFKIVVKPRSNTGTHLGIRDAHWFVRNMLLVVVAMSMWSTLV